ncbi:hypothetical protein [Nocardia sp. NPDC051750]|uniref:hypothetical protein n=1 Tax=Nocardia sp. NPDC051750 TaxID=3364325 RepID=UPI0037B89A97
MGGFMKGAATGAIGGLLGGAVGKWAVGKALGKWSDSAAKKVDDLGNPDALKAADNAVKTADQDLARAEAALKRHEGMTRPPGNGKAAQKFDDKREELNEKVAELKDHRTNLKDNADELRKKTASSDELKKAEANQKRADWWKDSKIPYHSLVGLGSALVRQGYNSHNTSGGGSEKPEGGAEAPVGEETVPLVWSGLAAANSAGLFGKPPFVADPSIPATGSGFLAHPDKLNQAIATWYGGASNSFASSLVDNYQMFGDLEKKEDLKVTPIRALVVPAGVSAGSEGGAGYSQAVQALNASAKGLNQSQSELAGTLAEVEEITRTGQENIASLIAGVNGVMPSIPAGDIDASFVTLLNQAIGESMGIMADAQAAAELAAATVGNPGLDTNPSGDDLANAVGQIDSGIGNSALMPDSSTLPSPTELDNLIPDPIDTDNGVSPELDNAIDRIQQASANPAVPANMAATDPSSNMMNSMMSSMLPMMMQQAMMRNMTDSDLAGHRAEMDPARYEQPAAPPAPVAPPVGTTPWSAQQAATTPPPATQAQAPAHPQTHTGPSSGATSSQAGGTPPRTPGADGSVVYTFPDGRTQKVSPMVAKVLDKAFANIKSTDAQEAYADTEAKWTDRKEIGTRVDPYQLMTGDVATWDDRTAVLVVFGSAEEGTLEVVVNGELQPFTPEMSDSTGEFGQFTGFLHPPGIEVGAGQDSSGDGGAAPSGDQQTSPQSSDAPLAAMPA